MKISCIYIIKSRAKQGSFYIGSTIDFCLRKKRHINLLAKNKHHSLLLQNHCNKYGLSDLSFEILERVFNVEILIKREQFYFDKYSPKLNVCKIAGNSLGTKHSEETKMKIIHILTGKKQKQSTINKRISSFIGIKRSQETKDKISAANRGKKRTKEMNLRNSERTKLSMTLERKEYMRMINIGKKHSQEHKNKISLGGMGRIQSQECKDKISFKNKGSKRTQESKEKMRLSQTGKKQSAETLLKRSEAMKKYHQLKKIA